MNRIHTDDFVGEGAMTFWAMTNNRVFGILSRHERFPRGPMSDECFCVDRVEKNQRALANYAFEDTTKSLWTENCTLEKRTVAGDSDRAWPRVTVECAGDTAND